MQVERRRKERLDYTIPLRVRGSEKGGTLYRFETVAQNIGAGGLCALATRMMRVGERLSLRIRFAHPGSTAQAPEISVRGSVVRAEEQPAGLCRFAVYFLLRRVA
jgi:hypothetical protein